MNLGGNNSDPRLSAVIVSRILLVEDEPDSAEFLKTILERQRYEVLVAKDGGQAQSMFVMRQPDFVILDIMLPGESGFEVCERFKKKDPAIPVVFLSAIELEDSLALAKKVGGDAYVTKPYDPDDLIKTIQETARTVWLRVHDMTPQEDGEHPVRFTCRCGKRFKVNCSHRGKSLNCPNCGTAVVVPWHD